MTKFVGAVCVSQYVLAYCMSLCYLEGRGAFSEGAAASCLRVYLLEGFGINGFLRNGGH